MERPETDLWEKSYRQDMLDWCTWNVRNTKIDNLPEFMRWFMQQERGKMNPQYIIDAWQETQCVQ
jgi:hypothetical protein